MLLRRSPCVQWFVRCMSRIPPWEYNLRFDHSVGRKVPNKDALNAFKRLNNGMWIRNAPGKTTKRYMKQEPWRTDSLYAYTCTQAENFMLDRMTSPFWLRNKYYIDDIYEPYHVRHGLKTPRVDYKGRLRRERKKILLEDTVADRFFNDR